jgi:hypothetical protein
VKYRAQLDFFRAVLAKSNLRTTLLGSEPLPPGVDRELFRLPSPWARENTVYKLLDARRCCYLFLLLPGTGQALLVGPWLTREPGPEHSRYYADMPVIRDTAFIFHMVQVLGEVLWGDRGFSMVDVTRPDPVTTVPEDPDSPEEALRLLKLMETRYSYENQLMTTVAQGMEHRAEMMLRGFARHAVARDERRCFFGYVPMEGANVEEMVFPGSHSDVGGLYPDNHEVADVALSWIAQPAVDRGLRLKSGVEFKKDADPASVIIHDSQDEATNVWGLLPSPSRILTHLREHPLCKAIKSIG